MEKQTYLYATGLSKKGKANFKKFLRYNWKPVFKGQSLTPDIISAYEEDIRYDVCDGVAGHLELPSYRTKSGHPEVFTATTCELVFEEFEIED